MTNAAGVDMRQNNRGEDEREEEVSAPIANRRLCTALLLTFMLQVWRKQVPGQGETKETGPAR